MYINDEDKCIVCGAPLPEKCLLRFENMPASAQDIPDGVQIKNEHGYNFPYINVIHVVLFSLIVNLFHIIEM